MSVADHEHFMYINKAMRELRSTLVLRPENKPSCKQVVPNPEERQVLAAYFWKYLFEPCKALSLPLDFVYESIRALNLYTDSRGRYKGSVFGLLQQFGVESLAAKLYRDRHVLIPLIFTGYASRHRMLHGLSTIQAMYFHSIDGVEGSTLSYPSVRNFQAIQSVKYEANERGVAYASTRKAAIARACKELSTKHWTNAVGQCVDNVLARFKLVKDGKRKPDYSYATWRGDWVSTMGPTRYRRSMDVVVPDGWWTLCSSHVPDYCEFRAQVEMNDC